MHAEARWAWDALIRRAPGSPEALLLTGGVILREMTDDECRAAKAEEVECRRLGIPVTTQLRLRSNEYTRRQISGILELLPEEERIGRQRAARARGWHTKYGDLAARTAALPTPDECRALRVVQCLTQAQLGRRAGLDPGRISKWESGASPPTADKVEAYLLALGLDIAHWTQMSGDERTAHVAQLVAGKPQLKRVNPPRECCRFGHSDWKIRKDGNGRYCRTCLNAARRRARGKRRNDT
jgi:transcriptional regulator with XRE-family HTH domain